MTSEKQNANAKCRYSRHCAVFGANILKEEHEKQMCQPDVKRDERYVPRIPYDIEQKPEEYIDVGAEGICPAFHNYLLDAFLGDLEELITDIDRELKGQPPLT